MRGVNRRPSVFTRGTVIIWPIFFPFLLVRQRRNREEAPKKTGFPRDDFIFNHKAHNCKKDTKLSAKSTKHCTRVYALRFKLHEFKKCFISHKRCSLNDLWRRSTKVDSLQHCVFHHSESIIVQKWDASLNDPLPTLYTLLGQSVFVKNIPL